MADKIIHTDRGIDFRRIEQFIKMFQEKCQSKSRKISNLKSDGEKDRKAKAYDYFGLSSDIKAIKDIDEAIELLKTNKKIHEERIRDFTQTKEKRYNSYDDIREGSPIDLFIKSESQIFVQKNDEIWKLNGQISNELWYAKDIEEAIEIIKKFEGLLDGISLEVG